MSASPLAVILGAGPLLGRSVARRFAREGFRTVLVGLDRDFLEAEARLIPGSAAQVCDLAVPGAVPRLFEDLKPAHGDPEVMVYNASAGAVGGASDLDPAVLERDLRVNLLAPLEAVQAVLPAMRRAGRGTILLTGGGLALKAEPMRASGSAGKAALRQLALCLFQELAPEGIHAATLTIAGFIQPGSPFDPDTLAEHYWLLHTEAAGSWRGEVLLK